MIIRRTLQTLTALTGFFLAGLIPPSLQAAADDYPWQVGMASAVITPEQPMWLTGYADRSKPSQGKIHDLHAKALAIQDENGSRLIIITTDLLGIPRSLRKRVETAADQRFQLRPEELLLSASHTHCGPEIDLLRGLEWNLPVERTNRKIEYLNSLETTLLQLVAEALNKMFPARLSYTHARAGFAMNRRLKTDRGHINSPNPDGPVDHTVPVLQVHGDDSRLRAILFGYACHNTTLSFYQFCGDYSGFAQVYLEEAHPDALALFMSGCAGDQNPYPRRSLELAQQHGRALANAVEAAMDTQARSVQGPLRTVLENVDLEFARPPERAELEARLNSEDQYERLHARMLLEDLESKGQLPRTYPYPIQVVRFGNALTLVALAGEVVVDYSLRLKSEMTDSIAWIAAYCNDVMGYIPTARVLGEGGYEPVGSTKFYGLPGPFAESLEERIVQKVHELVQRVRSPQSLATIRKRF